MSPMARSATGTGTGARPHDGVVPELFGCARTPNLSPRFGRLRLVPKSGLSARFLVLETMCVAENPTLSGGHQTNSGGWPLRLAARSVQSFAARQCFGQNGG